MSTLGDYSNESVLRGLLSQILLDEAVSVLDASVQMQVVRLLCELQEQTESAYIFISHGLRAVRGISDWIAVMYLEQVVGLAPAAGLDVSRKDPCLAALRSAEPALPHDGFRPERIILEGTRQVP